MKNFTYKKVGMVLTLAFSLVALPFLTSAASLYRQLQLGMTGADVGLLQTFLAQDRTIYPQGLVTNYFGTLTKSAVSNFQARNGISTVGRVGPQTLAAINAQMNNPGVTSLDGKIRVIGAVSVSVTNTQATIAWNTGEATTASIYYSSTPISLTEGSAYTALGINASGVAVHTDLRTSHSGTLTGLSPNTVYYYLVYVKDAQGNESITLPTTFQTTN